jgi:hypothetical protein
MLNRVGCSVIPALEREAEARGSQIPGQPGLHNEVIKKKKKKERERESPGARHWLAHACNPSEQVAV